MLIVARMFSEIQMKFLNHYSLLLDLTNRFAIIILFTTRCNQIERFDGVLMQYVALARKWKQEIQNKVQFRKNSFSLAAHKLQW